jgi:hypothetical protein
MPLKRSRAMKFDETGFQVDESGFLAGRARFSSSRGGLPARLLRRRNVCGDVIVNPRLIRN